MFRRSLLVFLASVVMISNQVSADTKSDFQAAAGAAETFIEWTYKETPMGLFLPEPTDTPLPVVMFLHGCNNYPISSYHWIISALNAIEPCAVFLPTAPATLNTPYSCADWGGTYDSDLRPQMINALHELDSLIVLYGFDTKRQYLYGESMGGEGVYRLLMDLPTRFAGAVSAAGYTLNKGASQMAKTPLWILIGESDEMSPVDSSRAIYNSILSAGGTMVNYTEYPGLGHVSGIEQARYEPGLLEWLLNQNRSSSSLQRPGWKDDISRRTPHLSFVAGNLHVSSQLPIGTILTLFDINGKLIFKTDMKKNSVKLPTGVAGRIVLWNISNSQFSVSGKLSLSKQ